MASRKVDTRISLQKANMRKLFARVRGTSVTLSALVHAILTVQKSVWSHARAARKILSITPKFGHAL